LSSTFSRISSHTEKYRFSAARWRSLVLVITCSIANCSGVTPLPSFGFFSEMFSSISRQTSRCPFFAAKWKGVSCSSSSGFLSSHFWHFWR
jgi:hypothetical protein